MSDSLFDEVLNYPGLPTLPTVAVRLLELTSDPNVRLEEIERLVQSDQGLASKILRTVNSSFYGLKEPCSSIRRALAYLGLNAVKSLVLGFSLVDLTRSLDDDDHFDFVEYWRRSIYSATGARQLALAVDGGDPDEAFTSGMFQDIGLLAARLALKGRYAAVLAEARDRQGQLTAIEQKRLGFTHAEVGAALAGKWRLPDSVADCIRHHHVVRHAPMCYSPLVRIVALGRIAAEALDSSTPERPLADLMSFTPEWFGREAPDVEALLKSIAAAAHDIAKVLQQDIGRSPDIQETMSRAGEMLIALQIQTQREVEDLQRRQADLTVKVETDALTGIANRSKFNDLLATAIASAGKGRGSLALLFLDADRFKSVNDTHGHQVGDAVLVELARRLSRAVGDLGQACRYGGEEFAVVAPGLDMSAAKDLAERVRAEVAASPFALAHLPDGPAALPITVSVGASVCDAAASSSPSAAADIIAAADRAVYQAKKGGRNCVRFVAMSEGNTIPPEQAAAPRPANIEARVLIIEADALAATLLIALFRKVAPPAGPAVSWVCSIEQARQWIRRAESGAAPAPALVLCDPDLADGDGLELIRALSRSPAFRGVMVHALLASDDAARSQAALDAGAIAVHRKRDIITRLPAWSAELWAEAQPQRKAA